MMLCHPKTLRDLLFRHIPRSRLEAASARVGELARPVDDNYEQDITASDRSVRRCFPTVLQTVNFSGIPAGKPVVDAIDCLHAIEGNNAPDMTGAPIAGIPKGWQRRMIGQDGYIDRRAYTLCTLERLQTARRRRDVVVPASTKGSDPRKKLLSATRWNAVKPRFCNALGPPKSGAEGAE